MRKLKANVRRKGKSRYIFMFRALRSEIAVESSEVLLQIAYFVTWVNVTPHPFVEAFSPVFMFQNVLYK